MDRDAAGKPFDHSAVFYHDPYGIWKDVKLYMYTAIAPIPISTFAGEPSQSVGKNFIKSYAGVCLEGAIIALACIIFSVYSASPPAIGDTSLSAVTIVWNYVGELVFNLLVLVGAVKASDRIVKRNDGIVGGKNHA